MLRIHLPDGRDVSGQVMEDLAHVDPRGLRQQLDTPVDALRPQAEPVARSPLGPAPAAGSVRFGDESSSTKVLVRGEPDGALASALGTRFGRAARDAAGRLVVGSGPGEWLVLDDAGDRAGTRAAVSEAVAEAGSESGLTSVIDLTDGRALLRITGEGCVALLGRVCGIDFSDDFTPDGAALRTSVAKIVTDIVRDDVDGERSYLLHCERSSGQFLLDSLVAARG